MSNNTDTESLKLTKKQKKSLAFRERKSGKKSKATSNTNDGLAEMDDNALPAMEDQDLAGMESDSMEVGEVSDKAGRKAEAVAKGVQGQKKKGKDAVEKAGEGGVKPESGNKDKGKGKAREEPPRNALEGVKKRKRGEDEDGEEGKEEGEGKKSKKAKKEDTKQRFILFVGNLKYTTSKAAIEKHFAECDPPPSVRLLTPRPKPGVTNTAKSRGCAFLEFTSKPGLQQALKLHQSMLEGRMINVELTAGGGGKSETRMQKVRERNKGLLSQRTKKANKSEKSGSVPSRPDKPQRYSATSGLDHTVTTPKTWSVGAVVEETHRGGKKQRGARKVKPMGTGVNAIPVG